MTSWNTTKPWLLNECPTAIYDFNTVFIDLYKIRELCLVQLITCCTWFPPIKHDCPEHNSVAVGKYNKISKNILSLSRVSYFRTHVRPQLCVSHLSAVYEFTKISRLKPTYFSTFRTTNIIPLNTLTNLINFTETRIQVLSCSPSFIWWYLSCGKFNYLEKALKGYACQTRSAS